MRLAFATLRHQARQYLAPGLDLVLGVAFVASTLVLGASMERGVITQLTGDLRNYAAVVSNSEDRMLGASPPAIEDHTLRRIEQLDGVREVTGIRQVSAQLGDGGFAVVRTPPATTSRAEVTAGELPGRTGEVALSQTVASSSGLGVGDSLRVKPLRSGEQSASSERVRVVGIVDAGPDPRLGSMTRLVFAPDPTVAHWAGTPAWHELDVRAEGGAEAAVVREITALVGDGLTVRSGVEQAEVEANRQASATDMLTGLLLGFAFVALFVSALVVANTIAILLARRTRQSALLRCVGATRAQVVRSTLGEALLLGVVFAIVGVAVGIALAGGLITLANARGGLNGMPLAFAITPQAVLVPFATGVSVMLAAALLPVLKASKVTPLQALSPDAAVRASSRAGVVRMIVGALLVLGGAALLVAGVVLDTQAALASGMVGGALSFLGVLVLGSVLVPAVAVALGRVPARTAGVAGELAVDNTVRNPGRAASTASALLIGVTLVVMTLVGSASAEASVNGELDNQFPVDVMVQTEHERLPAGAVDTIADVDGVTDATALHGGALPVQGQRMRAVGLPADLDQVVRNQSLVPAVSEGEVWLRELPRGVRDGDRVRVGRGPGAEELAVRHDPNLAWDAAVSASTMRRVAPEMPLIQVVAKLADDADEDATVNAVRERARDLDASVEGVAQERARLAQGLRTATLVVTALLAVAVVIAIVGVANTLSLSVLERRRESAVMRALGLTRTQLGGMLAVEGALLALVGGLLGAVLGVGYGLAGTSTILSGGVALVVVIPWGQIVAVIAVAMLAGLLASVLPALRAARVAPAEALAVD